MASLEWLCAILAPRDLAPHPNFFTNEDLNFAGVLAILVSFDEQAWQRLQSDTRYLALDKRDTYQLRVIREMYPFDGQSSTSYARELCAELEIDRAVPISLITAVAMVAAERYREAISFLGEISSRIVEHDRSPEVGVFLGALYLQEAFRRYERGLEEDYVKLNELLPRVDRLLSSEVLSSASWRPFRTSLGVEWNSDSTIEDVLDELRASYITLVDALRPIGSDGWQGVVRSRAPYLTLTNFRTALVGHESLVEQQWKRAPYSSARTIFLTDPILTPLRKASLHAELVSNHGGARRLRRDQALALLVSPFSHIPPDRDGPITLLRRSRDEQQLSSALSKMRAEGPLQPLMEDAKRLTRQDEPVTTITTEALLVLDAASQLLNPGESGVVVSRIVDLAESISLGEYMASTRWKSPATVEVAAWRSALAVATMSGSVSDVMSRLLRRLNDRPKHDTLFAQRMPSVVAALDWDAIDRSTRLRWLAWVEAQVLERDDVDSFASNLLDMTTWLLSNISTDVRWTLLSRRHGLRMAGLAIDTLRLATDFSLNVPTEVSVVSVLKDALRDLYSDAKQGRFGFGSYPVTSMAATGLIEFGWAELWPALIRVLGSTTVPMEYKDPAFFYLASHSEDLSTRQVVRLRQLSFELVDAPTPAVFFEDETRPHPSCIAFLWSARRRSRAKSQIDEQVLRLVAHSDARARRVAAQMFGEHPPGSEPPWMSLLLLQLANDKDATVRAAAARSLGRAARRDSPWRSSFVRALVPLLGDGSLLVPLAGLRGLSDAAGQGPVPDELRDALEVAGRHPAAVVRREAIRALAGITPSRDSSQ
jgi:hypothetical protein